MRCMGALSKRCCLLFAAFGMSVWFMASNQNFFGTSESLCPTSNCVCPQSECVCPLCPEAKECVCPKSECPWCAEAKDNTSQTKLWVPTKEDPGGYRHMHDHAPAFSFVNSQDLLPKLKAVFGFVEGDQGGLDGMYAKELAMSVYSQAEDLKDNTVMTVLSVGSGDCSREVAMSRLIRSEHPRIRPHFTCCDPIDIAFEGANKTILALPPDERNGFAAVRSLAAPMRPWNAVHAHYSLHHFTDLKELFTHISLHLNSTHGKFVIADMITRNGHQRWPEQRLLGEMLWKLLPDSQRYDFILNKYIELFPNYDYTCNGTHPFNEGIHSQDILPLLVKMFSFQKFVAYGGVMFEYVGRRLAANFDTDNEKDKAFLEVAVALQNQAIAAGEIKPDQMIATLSLNAQLPMRVWKGLTPEFCVRRSEDPVDGDVQPMSSCV
eukprot:TRINITY_DN1895_c0_g1_i2.p1 TRINITY_DN1895_c0_g1~~TRINITY_DN1895_c0_g1_i2.p1  ORF type:complete len:435 (-),score=44.39 TRINITY_DN1895_c0_g1_i2:79-1383(-)